MNKKMLEAIKITVIIFVITNLIFSIIVSQDEHHIKTCQDEHCTYCTIIQISQNILDLSIAFIIKITIGFLVYFFLSRLCKKHFVFAQSSLVFQKVQLNE